MSLLLSLLLVSATSEAPVFQCVDTPDYDCKTGIYTGLPEQQLFPQDTDKLSEIYAPYWACHWEYVRQHKDFGSTSGAAATVVLQLATKACQVEKQNGDDKFDSLLAKQPRYGDVKDRDQLRERSRQQGTVFFEYLAAGKSGKRTEYVAMLETVAKHMAENTNAPNN